MISKWHHLKPTAISSRKSGKSIRDIEKELGVPRSTLSGWFRHINLSTQQNFLLRKRHLNSLVLARKKAADWHKEQKNKRLINAENAAAKLVSSLDDKKETLELALAMLYLGEGFKKSGGTGMGNSDPLICKFFLCTLKKIYKINHNDISIYLHLRADQNIELMKKYWSKKLGVPLERFRKVSVDKRTINSKTYSYYKGVCLISCGNIAIQRKLVYIGRKFCEKIANTRD